MTELWTRGSKGMPARKSVVSIAVLCVAAITPFMVVPSLCAQAPAGYVLLYEDNFEGNAVNEQDWAYRVDRRKLEDYANGVDRKENVSVHDGALHIVARKEKVDGKDEYTGGGVISKHQFGYGYYETLARPFMAGRGVHTSFWTRRGNIPNNEIFEVDSFEVDSMTFMHTNNLSLALMPEPGKEAPWPLRSLVPWHFRPDGWYLNGFEYTPNGITFYSNGKVTGHAEWQDLTAAQVVWLTALNGVKKVDEGAQPGESLFKYFRYYAKDYPGINILPNGDFEYNQKSIDPNEPVAWEQTGDSGSAFVRSGGAIHGTYFLRQGNEKKSYQVGTSEKLEYIMNGDYELTASVRSSGGQTVAQVSASGFGGKDVSVNIPAASGWQQITIPHISVTNHSVKIAVSSRGQAGEWLDIDNIQFMKPPLHGEKPHDPVPFTLSGEPVLKTAQMYPLQFGDESFIYLDGHAGSGDAVSVTFVLNAERRCNSMPLEREPRTGSAGWAFELTDRGDIVFRIGSAADHQDVVASHAYTAGHEQRVTGVFDHGVASLYIDEKLAQRQSAMTANIRDDKTWGKIGNTGAAYQVVGLITESSGDRQPQLRLTPFKGSISDLRIYNSALSLAEILHPSAIVP